MEKLVALGIAGLVYLTGTNASAIQPAQWFGFARV